MPQALLPLVPHGATPINDLLSVVRDGGQWTYFLGVRPVFAHDEADQRSFRMFTAQLICQGTCQQKDIVAVFGVAAMSVKRSVKKFRDEGIQAFYEPRLGRGAAVLTPEILRQAQELLHRGQSRRQVADQLGLKPDTLRKAIHQGRLFEPCHSRGLEAAPAKPVEVLPESAALPVDGNTHAAGGEHDPAGGERRPAAVLEIAVPATDKSQRTVQDAAAADGLGMACTRVCDRVAASLGLLPGGAATQFEPCRDVKFGGVLCALPALAQCGLFRHLEACFTSLGGYYTTLQVMTLLGYMALGRIKTVEQLQYESPGELGKLLGLDRVPEVRCLRGKLTALAAGDAPQQWAALLSRDWMEADPELAGTLYVDGHVRLYHGEQTQLPRRYVARQKLCLRGTTDYWTNDALGQPFFVVQRPIDQGLLEVLRNDVVPRLLRDVPGQPTQQELDADPLRHRFLLIFDREGYSPEFMRQMWQEHRVACSTYHKYPKEPWPESEFAETRVTLPSGEVVSLKLAERGSWIGSKREGLWVREVRKLTATSHQTSLISTAYSQTADRDAAALFSRWSQENFFRYAMQHYGIDLLAEYATEKIPGTNRPVVNPARRTLDSRRRSLQSQLTQRRARYAALSLHPESDPAKLPTWERFKGELVEHIEHLEHAVEDVKQQQKETPKHLEWKDLPEAAKCEQLAPGRKRLLDTVKMIAYRAETAMVNIVRETLMRADDARSLVRDLFRREADLTPAAETQELRVTVHRSSNPRMDRALDHLLKQLTAAEQPYPGTTFKLTYSLAGAPIPETVSE